MRSMRSVKTLSAVKETIFFLLISSILVGCTTSMNGRLTDQQICYRTRVFLDGWYLGYRAYGETHIGPYANFMAMRREVELTNRERPELFDLDNSENCEARFPEVNAPLPQFVRAAEGVIPIPMFYRTILAGDTPKVPDSGPAGHGTVIALGLIAAAISGGVAAPAATAQVIPLANGELLILP